MAYYCAVHKDENQNALRGEKLDMCSKHMVIHTGYDLDSFRQFVAGKKLVIWEMELDTTAKFGYRFKELVGIPN